MKTNIALRIAAFAAAVFLPFVSIAAEPALIGHWKLDDKDSDGAIDSSPSKNHGKVANKPGRSAGKIGGAFQFNGKDAHIEIPNSEPLDKLQAGSYSLAAWFKPANAPPGTDDANDAQYGIVIKTGWHEGLSYGNDKKFTMTHWLKGDGDPVWKGIGTWEEEFEPGSWYHLVGVVDTEENVVRIYVDGELKKTSESWESDAKARDYEQQTWKIGVAAPGSDRYAWNANGAIDDVRIYKGTLSEEQVRAIYEAGAAGKDK